MPLLIVLVTKYSDSYRRKRRLFRKDLQEKYGEPTPEALLESALRHVEILDRLNFDQFKVSVKASDVFLAVEAYRLLAKIYQATITFRYY